MGGWDWRQCCRALEIFYIRFCMYQGYASHFFPEAHCMSFPPLFFKRNELKKNMVRTYIIYIIQKLVVLWYFKSKGMVLCWIEGDSSLV